MILIAVLSIALALVMFGDYSWSNVLSKSRNDLVFENRNQEYGAYALRKEEARHMMWSIFLTVGLVTPLLLSARWLTSKPTMATEIIDEQEITKWVTLNIKPQEPIKTEEKRVKAGASVQQQVRPASDLPVEVVEQTVAAEPTDVLTPPSGNPGGGDGPLTLGGGGGTDPEGGSEPEVEKMKIFDFVSIMPQFVGGDAAKLLYVQKTARYPYRAKEVGVEGIIYVQFVVDVNGFVQDAKVIRSVIGGSDLEREALRVINNMPQWIPGSNNGHPVPVRQVIPVKFVLSK